MVLTVKYAFPEEIREGSFKVYSLPKNCSELDNKKLIGSLEDFNRFMAELDFENSLHKIQFYIFNSNDESRRKVPENRKVIQVNRSESSCSSNGSISAAQVCRVCRLRDENKCVFCG